MCLEAQPPIPPPCRKGGCTLCEEIDFFAAYPLVELFDQAGDLNGSN